MILVEKALSTAYARLVTIADDAPLIDAARLLGAGTDLVVCCANGALTGVVTKTDVVARMGRCEGAGCTVPASSVMTRDVLICRSGDWLTDVWSRMKSRGLKNVPVAAEDGRPLGVLNARDALQLLLRESQDEEGLLRDYVMSVGYQ